MPRACRPGNGGERSEPPGKRVARSRSDAPSLIDCIGERVSIIGTIGICTTIPGTVCTIAITTIPDTGTGITGIVVTIGFTITGTSTRIGIIDTRPS